MGRSLVEPGGKAGKPCPRFLHLVGRFRRHELRPLGAEQIGEIEEEEFYLFILRIFRELPRHDCPPVIQPSVPLPLAGEGLGWGSGGLSILVRLEMRDLATPTLDPS